MDSTLRVMKEVGNAFPLLWWYVGRVTREYWATASGNTRIGAVYGLVPNTDRDVALDLARAGFQCSADQIYTWRRKLASKGLIAWSRTPAGQRIFVIGSCKFPAEEAEPLPEWAVDLVSHAVMRRDAHSVIPTDHSVDLTEYSVVPTEHSVESTETIKKVKGNIKESEGIVKRHQEPLAFDSRGFKITQYEDQVLADAFPWIKDRQSEYRKMESWRVANPNRKRKNFHAFAHNWFSRIPVPENKVRREGWDDELDFPLAERPF